MVVKNRFFGDDVLDLEYQRPLRPWGGRPPPSFVAGPKVSLFHRQFLTTAAKMTLIVRCSGCGINIFSQENQLPLFCRCVVFWCACFSYIISTTQPEYNSPSTGTTALVSQSNNTGHLAPNCAIKRVRNDVSKSPKLLIVHPESHSSTRKELGGARSSFFATECVRHATISQMDQPVGVAIEYLQNV